MIRILFVCSANRCRSPTAQGILENIIEKRALQDQILVDSAGTHVFHPGNPPDPMAIQEAENNDIDISRQRTRIVIAEDFEEFDYIIGMDRYNIEHLMKISPEQHKPKIKLLTEFYNLEDLECIPDPYRADLGGFSHVYEIIAAATDTLLQQIIKRS